MNEANWDMSQMAEAMSQSTETLPMCHNDSVFLGPHAFESKRGQR